MVLLKLLSGVVVVAMLFGAMAFPAHAVTGQARSVLENTVNQVLGELKKPGLHVPGERKAILDSVERIIRTLFDFEELSARTVGPGWKKFTPEQQKRFTQEFSSLLRESYLESLEGYDGETVHYTGEQASAKGDKVEVFTTVMIKNKGVSVSYRMLKKENWVVYDVIIEGVSMVQNYRSQFQDMLLKGDVEALIAQVGKKGQEMRDYNKKRQISQ